MLLSYDEELTQPVLDALKKSGVVLHLGCSVLGWTKARACTRNARADEFALPAERVLVAVGAGRARRALAWKRCSLIWRRLRGGGRTARLYARASGRSAT